MVAVSLKKKRDAALAKIGGLLPQVQRLHQLYKVLDKARAKRGAIEFESSEVRFVLDAKGAVSQAGMLQRNDAHKLIEECMIAANVQAALYLLQSGVPAPYRDHDKPPEQSAERFVKFIDSFNSQWVGMYYDIGNHWKYGQPREWLRAFGRRAVKLDVEKKIEGSKDWSALPTSDDMRKLVSNRPAAEWNAARSRGD